MNVFYVTAALLVVLLGVAHSWLGERLILTRLFRRDNLPKLFGGDRFTKWTLRFTWHLTTVLLWGIGALLVAGARPGTRLPSWAGKTIAATLFVSTLVSLVGARGRHFSWGVLLVASILVWIGSG